MVAQYAGALLLTSALVSVGLWASSLTRNQITAFIVALATIFVLMAMTLGVVLAGLPPVLGAAATRLGLLPHFAAIARGVLDLRDFVYFISVTAAFLSLAYLMLERNRLNLRGREWRTLRLGTLGIVLICIVVNLLGGHVRGRFDLTPGKAYTLSETTRDVLRDLDDIVTVKFFASRELPPMVELVRRDACSGVLVRRGYWRSPVTAGPTQRCRATLGRRQACETGPPLSSPSLGAWFRHRRQVSAA